MKEIYIDTNIFLDFLLGRNKKIEYLIASLLDKKSDFCISLSWITLIEIQSKMIEIKQFGKLLLEKKTFDEILKSKKRNILTNEEREEIRTKMNDFFQEYREKIKLYNFGEGKENTILSDSLNLITDYNSFDIQDCLILSIFISSPSNYFITKDQDFFKNIKKVKEDIPEIFENKNIFKLTNEKEIESFRNLINTTINKNT